MEEVTSLPPKSQGRDSHIYQGRAAEDKVLVADSISSSQITLCNLGRNRRLLLKFANRV